jgi:hypothetical protein
LFDFRAIGHVGHEVADLHVEARLDLGLSFLEFVFMPAGDDDVGAGLGEAARHGLAEPLAAARDQRCSPGEIEERMH